jgi:hypothetical protein
MYCERLNETAPCEGFSTSFEVGGGPPFLEIEVGKRTRSARRLWSCHACVLHAVVVIPSRRRCSALLHTSM